MIDFIIIRLKIVIFFIPGNFCFSFVFGYRNVY